MKLLTLLEIEIKKLIPVLIVILGLMTLASVALFYQASDRLNMDLLQDLNGISVAEFVEANGGVTLIQAMDNLHLVLFNFTAILLVASSSFYLWYKEWFGQSKRIYLLLSLRGPRYTILLSKLITVIGATFIFYGTILINLFIGWLMLTILLPDGIMAANLISNLVAQATHSGFSFSFPISFLDFIYKLFFVTVAFSGISCWVLSDRSQKIWGFILGGAYCIALANIYIRTQTRFLFFDERVWIDWGFALGASTLSLLISYILLNKKVSI